MIQQKANEMFRDQEVINAKGQIVDQEKFNEAMMALMNDKFVGGMEKQAGTLRGIWSTITGVTKSGLANMLGMTEDGNVRIGSALDIIGQHAQNLAKQFEQWQSDGTLDRWAANFDKTFGTIAQTVGPMISSIKDGLAGFGNWFQSLDKEQQQFIIKIGLVVAALGPVVAHVASFVGAVAPAIQHVAGFAKGFGTLFGIGSKVGGLLKVVSGFLMGPWGVAIGIAIAVGVTLYKNWDKIKEVGVKAFDKVKEVIGRLGDKIQWLKDKVTDFIHNSHLAKIGEMIGGAVSTVTGALGIGANAQGTNYWRGGLTTINERGGEIIDLERGARVYPHDESVRMAYQDGKRSGRSGSVIVNFNDTVFHVREEADIDRVAQSIVRRLTLAERNRVPAV